jgi:hypothetical protein
MADFPLTNTLIYHFLIEDLDAAGVVVPPNPGDVVSVVSGNPASIAMSIGTMPASAGPVAGEPSLDCAPGVILSDATNGGGGITATLSDTAGLPMAGGPLTFSVVDSLAPTSIGALLTTVATTPQPRPTATGP